MALRSNKCSTAGSPTYSLDHLVGAGEQNRWDSDPECVRRFHVDDHLHPCWQVHVALGGAVLAAGLALRLRDRRASGCLRPPRGARHPQIAITLAPAISRGFSPWRLFDAGPHVCQTVVMDSVRNPLQELPNTARATEFAADVRPNASGHGQCVQTLDRGMVGNFAI